MKEQSEARRDPYWTHDVGLFEGWVRYTRDEPAMVRIRISPGSREAIAH
jgi:hypothetical protein